MHERLVLAAESRARLGPPTNPRLVSNRRNPTEALCWGAGFGSVPKPIGSGECTLTTLRAFWAKHPQAEVPLRVWYAEASRADWKSPAAIKLAHRTAGFLANNRVVFNIKGNDCRLVVAVHYNREMMFIRFVGTHREYDRIDAATI